MPTLIEDFKTYADKLVYFFVADGLTLDYSLDSFKVIDEFFDLYSRDGKAIPGGRLDSNFGQVIFALGGYVGETIIRNFPGSFWITDDSSADGEYTAQIELKNGLRLTPVLKVMKRFENGTEDSLYPYAMVLKNEYAK